MMKRRFFWSSVIVLSSSVPAGLWAQTIDEFTIADGSVTYHEENLQGHRLGLAGGLANFLVGGPDHLFQNWWWYRTTGDTREFALGGEPWASTQVFGAVTAPNSARIVYEEPPGLLFDFEYTVSDLEPGSEKPDLGIITIAFKIKNLTSETLSVNFFSYFDFDVNGDFSDDVAEIMGVSNHIQRFADIPQGTQNPTDGVVIASSTGLVGWQISPFADILAALADDDIDNLTNSGSPFGPGDYTGAFQWSFELTPRGQFVGSVTKAVNVVPEPSSLLVFGVGGALLLARRRRR